MTYTQALEAVVDWKENNPEKFQAWEWFGMGIKKAEIVDVRKNTTEVSYKTLSDDGTIYPVNQNNVISKL